MSTYPSGTLSKYKAVYGDFSSSISYFHIKMSDDKQLTGKKRSRAEAAATPAAGSDDEGGDAKKLAVQGPTSPIAVPMAGKKLHKKVYKVVTKAAKAKALRRGVKEVVKAIRKGQSGCVILNEEHAD